MQIATLAASIKESGGIHCARINGDCTHLVASQKDFEGSKPKGELSFLKFRSHIFLLSFHFSFLRVLSSLIVRTFQLSKHRNSKQYVWSVTIGL